MLYALHCSRIQVFTIHYSIDFIGGSTKFS
jgi:hypothetical protein